VPPACSASSGPPGQVATIATVSGRRITDLGHDARVLRDEPAERQVARMGGGRASCSTQRPEEDRLLAEQYNRGVREPARCRFEHQVTDKTPGSDPSPQVRPHATPGVTPNVSSGRPCSASAATSHASATSGPSASTNLGWRSSAPVLPALTANAWARRRVPSTPRRRIGQGFLTRCRAGRLRTGRRLPPPSRPADHSGPCGVLVIAGCDHLAWRQEISSECSTDVVK